MSSSAERPALFGSASHQTTCFSDHLRCVMFLNQRRHNRRDGRHDTCNTRLYGHSQSSPLAFSMFLISGGRGAKVCTWVVGVVGGNEDISAAFNQRSLAAASLC